jgi:hypothetical protein
MRRADTAARDLCADPLHQDRRQTKRARRSRSGTALTPWRSPRTGRPSTSSTSPTARAPPWASVTPIETPRRQGGQGDPGGKESRRHRDHPLATGRQAAPTPGRRRDDAGAQSADRAGRRDVLDEVAPAELADTVQSPAECGMPVHYRQQASGLRQGGRRRPATASARPRVTEAQPACGASRRGRCGALIVLPPICLARLGAMG